MINLFSLV